MEREEEVVEEEEEEEEGMQVYWPCRGGGAGGRLEEGKGRQRNISTQQRKAMHNI